MRVGSLYEQVVETGKLDINVERSSCLVFFFSRSTRVCVIRNFVRSVTEKDIPPDISKQAKITSERISWAYKLVNSLAYLNVGTLLVESGGDGISVFAVVVVVVVVVHDCGP